MKNITSITLFIIFFVCVIGVYKIWDIIDEYYDKCPHGNKIDEPWLKPFSNEFSDTTKSPRKVVFSLKMSREEIMRYFKGRGTLQEELDEHNLYLLKEEEIGSILTDSFTFPTNWKNQEVFFIGSGIVEGSRANKRILVPGLVACSYWERVWIDHNGPQKKFWVAIRKLPTQQTF